MSKQILVAALRVDSDEAPIEVGLIENTMSALQRAVGGNIELFTPAWRTTSSVEAARWRGAVFIYNEDSLSLPVHVPVNIYAACLGLTIRGNLLICNEISGAHGREFTDISPEILALISARFTNVKRLETPLDFEQNDLG